MKNFRFNKIIVIESLDPNERHTGKELYDDLIARMPYLHSELLADYKKVNTLKEWDALMNDILTECNNTGNIPILHLEIHGEGSGKGLVTSSNELIPLEHVGNQFRDINVATGCNLFITLGVCKGLYLLFNMHMNKPMPFIGAVGSFDTMLNSDIYIRYYDFYDTFFRTLDIASAYVALQKANPDLDSKYRYMPADELFYKNYQEYLNKQCTDGALKARAKESIATLSCKNRHERRLKEKLFIKQEKIDRGKYFRNHAATFFMTNEFPENKERFDVPKDFKKLKERYDNLVMV